MDLKLEDVAQLLNVSEATVQKWVSEDKIPHYRLKEQCLFSRSEIESWMFSGHSVQNSETESFGLNHYGLYRAVHKGGVYHGVPGATKDEIITNAMKLIAPNLKLDAEVLTELLLERESLMSTGLGLGIAVPHIRDCLIEEAFDLVTVVFPEKPIEYGALDGQPVHTLFFLFACDDKRHLHLLAKIAHLCRKAEHLQFLRAHPAKRELLEFVKQWESHLNAAQTGGRRLAGVGSE